jgi:hypothetical protein
MSKTKAKKSFLAAVDKLELLRIAPEDLGHMPTKVRKYVDAFDAQTNRALYAAFRYLLTSEKAVTFNR